MPDDRLVEMRIRIATGDDNLLAKESPADCSSRAAFADFQQIASPRSRAHDTTYVRELPGCPPSPRSDDDSRMERRQTGPDPRKEADMATQSDETPVLDLLATMTASSLEASSLDPPTLMLVRIAALVAVDAPPASYLLNLGAAAEIDVELGQVRGVLAAIAPIVGTARVASATGNIVRALGLALESAELEQ
jgi:hypothetical protein